MLEVQEAQSSEYVATMLNNRSELITKKRHISFVVHDEDGVLEAFDRLVKAGMVEEILADDEEMTTEELESLERGLEDIKNGRVYPIEQLWELAQP